MCVCVSLCFLSFFCCYCLWAFGDSLIRKNAKKRKTNKQSEEKDGSSLVCDEKLFAAALTSSIHEVFMRGAR